jgi:pantothenate kinase
MMPLGESPRVIPFPTFDHALKDPLPSPVPLTHSHRIVLIEGLYTCLDTPGWRECAEMMDERIWVEVDREVARQRLVSRNFAAGISESLEKCTERGEPFPTLDAVWLRRSPFVVDASDMLNGEFVRSHRLDPTHIVVSVDA